MEIRIKTKNLKLNPKLEKFIQDKLRVLQKFFPRNAVKIIDIEVGLVSRHHQKGDIYRAEIQTETPLGRVLRAYSEKDKIETAILDAKQEIEAQFSKFKDKLVSIRKKDTRKEI